MVEKTKRFLNPFSILGENWEVTNDLFNMLAELSVSIMIIETKVLTELA